MIARDWRVVNKKTMKSSTCKAFLWASLFLDVCRRYLSLAERVYIKRLTMGNGKHQKVKQGVRCITPTACAIFAIGTFIGGTRSHKGVRRQGGELMDQDVPAMLDRPCRDGRSDAGNTCRTTRSRACTRAVADLRHSRLNPFVV